MACWNWTASATPACPAWVTWTASGRDRPAVSACPGGAGGRPGPHAAHVAQWLWWLRECSAEYQAQPYEALAAAYGGAGYDDLARRIPSPSGTTCATAGRSARCANSGSTARSG